MEFYEVTIPIDITEATWSRIASANSSVHAVVAVDNSSGSAVGLANYVTHPFTWSDRWACYLEDLYVRPPLRGTGVGGALLRHLIALSREKDWARLYWMTRQDNHVARRLYDRFATHDAFIRYVVNSDGTPAD